MQKHRKTEVFRVRIGDDEKLDKTVEIKDPVPTGRQILDSVGIRPAKNYQLIQVFKDGRMEEIGLDETSDLRKPQIERFFVFETDRLFAFEIDDRRVYWGHEKIKESTLRFLAGVGKEYSIWRERRGCSEDELIETGSCADLTDREVECFFSGKDKTNAGDATFSLPSVDQTYFDSRQSTIQLIEETNKKGLVLVNFDLPKAKFNVSQSNILILLPPSYPDSAPDMFYSDPWLKLNSTNSWPKAADQSFKFSGRNWQRWSRHNNEWRPGIDSLRSFICRIQTALRTA